jgi:hypothetical protein
VTEDRRLDFATVRKGEREFAIRARRGDMTRVRPCFTAIAGS